MPGIACEIVPGHLGKLVFGFLGEIPAVLMVGRAQ